jgi:hypothetical protein
MARNAGRENMINTAWNYVRAAQFALSLERLVEIERNWKSVSFGYNGIGQQMVKTAIDECLNRLILEEGT